MRVIKLTIYEIIFIIVCITINLFINGMGLERLLLPLIIIILFGNLFCKSNLEIKKNREFIHAFILVFFLYVSIQGYYDYTNVNKNNYSLFKVLLIQLPITMTVLVPYIFGIKIRNFNWRISLTSLLLILLVWLSIEILPIIRYVRLNSITDLIKVIVINIPIKIYYPSIVEEVIFRGLCFSGLLAIGLSEDKSNIIQAIIFGLVHILNYEQFSINILLLIVPQIYIGYLIGKIYINTKSLTPCIILHALLDSI